MPRVVARIRRSAGGNDHIVSGNSARQPLQRKLDGIVRPDIQPLNVRDPKRRSELNRPVDQLSIEKVPLQCRELCVDRRLIS